MKPGVRSGGFYDTATWITHFKSEAEVEEIEKRIREHGLQYERREGLIGPRVWILNLTEQMVRGYMAIRFELKVDAHTQLDVLLALIANVGTEGAESRTSGK